MKPSTALIVYCIVALAENVAIFVAGGDDGHAKEDVQILGQYGLTTDPDNADLIKYMQVMEVTEEMQKRIRDCKKLLMVINKINATHCQVTRITKKCTFTMTFQPGKEFEAMLPDGRMKMTTINVDKEKKMVRKVIKMGGFEATHEATFCKEGMNITMKAKEAMAMLTFTRLALKAPMNNTEEMKKEYFTE